MSGAEFAALAAALGPEIAAPAALTTGGTAAAGMGAATGMGAVSPMAASLLGPSITPFVTGAPGAAAMGGGTAAMFGPAAGATELLGPGLLGLGAPPAVGAGMPWSSIAKGAAIGGLSGMAGGGQQQPQPQAPRPPQGDPEALQKALMAWMAAGKVDPRMKQQLMLAMRGGR